MQIEHIAWQVQSPAQVAAWYGEHLGLTVRRRVEGKPDAHFLADGSGRVLLEIYNNPAVDVPDYAARDPLYLHLAFVSADVDADCARLIEAGATLHTAPLTTSVGDRLAMLRDPWGFAIQLCCRKEAM
jgi:uncharacterized glyoxalase superfamily protein PhnB